MEMFVEISCEPTDRKVVVVWGPHAGIDGRDRVPLKGPLRCKASS